MMGGAQDISRIKANISKMIDQDAQEEEIDAYIASEGVTLDMLQGANTGQSAVPDAPMQQAGQQPLPVGAQFSAGLNPQTIQLASQYQERGRAPQGAPMADEEVRFGDQTPLKTGFRYSADEEAQILNAMRSGDLGQTVALSRQFSGNEPSEADIAGFRKVIESLRANPNTPIGFGYDDESAKQAAETIETAGYNNVSPEELRKNDVLPETVDAGARGAALGLDDEIDAAVSTALGKMGIGEYSPHFDDNFARAKAIKNYDEENHPTARLVGGLVGSLALPTKFAGVARPAATAAYQDARAIGLGVTEARNLATAAARRAVGNQFAKEGAAYGGAMGAAEGDSLEERITGGASGAGIGAAVGRVLPEAGSVLRNSHEANLAAPVTRELTEGQQVMQAAGRQGIDVLPADVGGSATRRMTAGTAQTPFGSGPIQRAGEKSIESAEAARDRIAASVGEALNPEALGTRVSEGALARHRADKQEAGVIFDMAERAAEGARVTPTKALEVLDRNIAELGEIPGGADGLATLQSIRADLAKGDHSVKAIRSMRTALRDEFLRTGLTGSDIERRVNQVVEAAQDDVTTSLADQGKGAAASLYAKGNEKWREIRLKEKQVLDPILGKDRDNPNAPEQIVKTIMSDLNGNNGRSVKLLHSLPPETQKDLQASIIGGLGRVGEGAQDAEGAGFSMAHFLTQWNKIGETAKAAYFGKEARAALNDLAIVANASKQGAKVRNASNTGGAIEANRLFTYLTAIPTLGFSVASQYGLGRLLASPRFARWLARAPKTALSDAAYLDRLSRIARAEPAIANDVLQLQTRLSDMLRGGQAGLAAEEGNDGAPRIDTQQEQPNQAPQ